LTLLGIDTATSSTAVALLWADGSKREARDDPPPGAHPGHATRLLELARGLLEEASLEWGALERVAVGTGPGTFTGLRVGIATARGLAQSLGVGLVPVSSARALARPALAERGAVLSVIDARRGEVFAAVYGSGGDELVPPRAMAPESVGDALAQAGLAPGQALAVGDGALRYREALAVASLEVPPESSGLHWLRALAVCSLALDEEGGGYGAVLPDYRRRPDAELALEGTGRGKGDGR
jgi:tRNA threonylcarbamoyladenosine biosynthesis protein TsaB